MKYIEEKKACLLLAAAINFSLVKDNNFTISHDVAIINESSDLYSKDDDNTVARLVKNKEYSLIKCDTGLRYVKNSELDIIPYVYSEMLKYNIYTNTYSNMYINEKCIMYESPNGNELAAFDKYEHAYSLFKVDKYSYVCINGAAGYVETKYLSEPDFEYNEALKYPDKKVIDTYVYFSSDTKINDELKISKWQKAYGMFSTGDKTLIKYDNEYYYVPTNNVEVIGDTFIDVDLSDQYVQMYKNDEVKISGDCVTGNTITPTNEGLFKVYQIDGQRYLSGYNLDGSRYNVPVDCFIAFDGGIGFHNVTYRTKPEHFAKDLYKRGKGSHGCVNMYKNDVLKMYDELKSSENNGIGYKVLVHE